MFQKILFILLFAGLLYGDDVQNGIDAAKKKDYKTASKSFQKACDGGDASGCLNVGAMYANGTTVRQSNELALKYFGKACDMKLEEGCINYAKLKQR